MSESKGGGAMYLRLQIAYALEFAVWGCWSYALGTFCTNHGIAQGKLYAAFALGALFAPVVGPIADKKFAAQKVFAFMQLVCGFALLACHKVAMGVVAAGGTVPGTVWIGLMFVAGLMFMPSIPLLNAIVFKHIPNKDRSPLVFIFGTLGWIAINLILGAMKETGIENLYLVNGAVALILAVYALTLPNTPPSGNTNSDPFGFKALSLFARFDFAIFIICATLVGIFGSNYYFALIGQAFPEKGTMNQFSEIFFMAALAFAVSKIGLKWVLTLGMAAWGVRYYLFSTGSDSMALIGILCHGVAYAFLYTAAYMYGDKIAPKEMKASVQALIAFLLLGVAQTLSGFAVDEMTSRYKNDVAPAAPTAVDNANFSLISVAYAQDESIAETAEEPAIEIADAVQENVEAAADAVQEAAADAVDAAQENVEAAPDAVQEAASDAVDAVQENVEAATDAVQEAASDAVDAAQDQVETVTDVVEGVISDVVGGDEETTEVAEGTEGEEATPGAAADAGAKEEYSLWDVKKVWNRGEWDKFNWQMIWGIPSIFCLFWALVFALLGKEPVSPDEETKE